MPDLVQLGDDLRKIDRLIMDLVKRRMDVAQLVAQEKQRTSAVMYRPDVEDQRIKAIGEHAALIGLNPHMARALLYFLIAESCKEQTILLESAQGKGSSPSESARLKENLLQLTEKVADRYDQRDADRKIATQLYNAYEAEMIAAEAARAPERGLALDLGCGTGRVAVDLAKTFDQVVGYDISPHMLVTARRKAMAANRANVRFVQLDLDAGRLPEADGKASFVVMNRGTASDVADLPHILTEIERVLAPGGRFFLTFYNSDALLAKMGFLPWVASLEAVVNPYTNCLDVKIDEEVMTVHAQMFSEADVRLLAPPALQIEEVLSFPQIAAVLPDEVLHDGKVRATIEKLDRELVRGSDGVHGGAYLIVCGRRA